MIPTSVFPSSLVLLSRAPNAQLPLFLAFLSKLAYVFLTQQLLCRSSLFVYPQMLLEINRYYIFTKHCYYSTTSVPGKGRVKSGVRGMGKT